MYMAEWLGWMKRSRVWFPILVMHKSIWENVFLAPSSYPAVLGTWYNEGVCTLVWCVLGIWDCPNVCSYTREGSCQLNVEKHSYLWSLLNAHIHYVTQYYFVLMGNSIRAWVPLLGKLFNPGYIGRSCDQNECRIKPLENRLVSCHSGL